MTTDCVDQLETALANKSRERVIARLRKSRQEQGEADYRRGKESGVVWAADVATARELEALYEWDTTTADRMGCLSSSDDLFVSLWEVISGQEADADDLTPVVRFWHVWLGNTGEPRKWTLTSRLHPEFFRGF